MRKERKFLKIRKICGQLNREIGSLTLEAIISLTVFIVCIITVLSFLNYCRIQTLISNAVDTAAKEMSQYAYVLEITGLKGYNDAIYKAVGNASDDAVSSTNAIIGSLSSIYDVIGKSGKGVEDAASNIKIGIDDNNVEQTISTMKEELEGLSDNAVEIQKEMEKMKSAFGDIQKNPLQYMKGMAAFAGGEAFSAAKSRVIAAPLAKAFVAKHFGNTKEEADKALEALGVIGGLDGLNFNLSTIFSPAEPEDIHIVVYYKIKILNFFDFEFGDLIICKESRTRAWLGGDKSNIKASATDKTDSIWSMSSLEYGKQIIKSEKNAKNGDAYLYPYTSSRNGFHAYNNRDGKNEFLQFRALKIGSQTYQENQNAIKNTIVKDLKELGQVDNLKSQIPGLYDHESKSVSITSAQSTRTKQLVIVVPEGTTQEQISRIVSAGEEAKESLHLGNDYTITVKTGYGTDTSDMGGSE